MAFPFSRVDGDTAFAERSPLSPGPGNGFGGGSPSGARTPGSGGYLTDSDSPVAMLQKQGSFASAPGEFATSKPTPTGMHQKRRSHAWKLSRSNSRSKSAGGGGLSRNELTPPHLEFLEHLEHVRLQLREFASFPFSPEEKEALRQEKEALRQELDVLSWLPSEEEFRTGDSTRRSPEAGASSGPSMSPVTRAEGRALDPAELGLHDLEEGPVEHPREQAVAGPSTSAVSSASARSHAQHQPSDWESSVGSGMSLRRWRKKPDVKMTLIQTRPLNSFADVVAFHGSFKGDLPKEIGTIERIRIAEGLRRKLKRKDIPLRGMVSRVNWDNLERICKFNKDGKIIGCFGMVAIPKIPE